MKKLCAQKALRLDEDEKADVSLTDISSNGVSQMRKKLAINEPGLYSLILRSRKPVAKTFKRWVTHDVLPEIRKTGSYSAKPASAPELASVDTVRYLLGEYDKKAAEVKRLEAQTKKMAPKAQFFDAVSNAGGNVNLQAAAKMPAGAPTR